MKILVTIKKRIIHKTLNQSSIKDEAPKNKRTAICGIVIENTEVSGAWKKVNCEHCLSHKIKE